MSIFQTTNLSGSGNQITLTPDDTIYLVPGVSVGSTNNGWGITSTGSANVTVSGNVFGSKGIYLGSSGVTGTSYVDITKTGQVVGSMSGEAVNVNGSSVIHNNGEIYISGGGGYGIETSGRAANSIIYNEGSIAAANGVVTTNDGLGGVKFYNSGSLTGFSNAYYGGGTGSDIVTNRGSIVGNVYLGDGNDSFDGVGGALQGSIDGGNGLDTISYSGFNHGVVFDLGSGLVWDGLKNQVATGFEGAIGTAFADVFYGSGVNDVFDPGSGGADFINGNNGNDTVTYANSLRAVIVDLGSQLSFDGVDNDTFVSIESATGSMFNDTIYGTAGDNVIDGGPAGADQLFGGNGIDTLSYASSNTAVIIDLPSNATYDYLVNDTISGFENLTGSRFSDIITGNAGANVITGGAGADSLTGGAGADTFTYNFLTEGNDTITDFVSGVDHLAFSYGGGFVTGAGLVANGAPVAPNGAAVFLYNTASGVLTYDPDGTGSLAAFNIAILTGHPTLTSADFIFLP